MWTSTLVRSRAALFLLATWLLSGLSIAGADDQFAPVRERIERALSTSNVPSMAVAVAKDGRIIWEQGFGIADRENRTPATEHTMYSLASISKPITATGLMLLVERKKIDLDKPIDEYLGEAKLRARVGNAADATVRRVANHTAGLPLHYQFFYENESHRPPAFDETIRRYGNLVTAPGERYQYSNLGYGMLDYLIERTSGKKYADFMREEVFLPLGLTHTSVDIAPGLESHRAIRYTPEGKRIPFYTFDHPGASAVYSSAHDLVRFAMFHLKDHLDDQRPILSDESIDAMQVSTVDTPVKGDNYGVGWGSFDNRKGYHCIQHTGGMPGVSTTCRLIPSERIAIVVLANSRAPIAYGLADTITDLLLPQKKEKKEDDAESKDDDKKENAKQEPNRSLGFTPSAELIGEWQGKIVTYQGEARLRLEIKDTADVHLRVDRQLETLLNGPNFRDGVLRGRFAGKLPYDDNRGDDYTVELELKLREGKLSGGAITHATNQWGESAVTHWVELEKKK